MRSAAAFLLCGAVWAQSPAFRFEDITQRAGLRFHHNSGAAGNKWLPETMGPGAAFLDFDNDGYADILLVNGRDWVKKPGPASTPRLYRNNRDGTFTDVTRQAGLTFEMYGMGVAAADYDNDGWTDIYLTAVGQSRLLRNTGRGTFTDVTTASGLGGREAFSTSAMWFDYDRDGRLDLLVANYVRWSAGQDIFCSFDGGRKAYCTPEVYRGVTSWLFRNLGGGRFEDATAKSRLFDPSSKALGAALLDHDQDGWPDVLLANDTQPNKLYRNNRDGTFSEIGVRAGLAFSNDGKARAGMGVDAMDLDGAGRPTIVLTNFDNEMLGLYKPSPDGAYIDVAPRGEVGRASRRTLGFGCFFFDADLDGLPDLLVVNGHIDDTISRARPGIEYAQPPQLFWNAGREGFRSIAAQLGPAFTTPRVGRGAAYADIDNDGDLDVLLTVNNGQPVLLRNDLAVPNRSVRLRLTGTTSNRDAIGAVVRFEAEGLKGTRMVRTGSSYLSQSELTLTIGLGTRPRLDRVEIEWPSGARQRYQSIPAGSSLQITEGKDTYTQN